MRARVLIPLFTATMTLACTGEISVGDPTVEVTSLGLSTLELGALQADLCVVQRGKQACAQYPNPNACDQLRISIRGNGSTVGTCSKQGQPDATVRGVSAGIPIICRMDATGGCVQCEDVYGGAVVDTCGERTTQLFSGKGFLPGGSGTLPPAGDGDSSKNPPPPPGSGDGNVTTPPSGTPPPGGAASKCDDSAVKKAFVDALNAMMTAEGLTFSWSPDLSTIAGGGFFDALGFKYADKICSAQGAPLVQDNSGCDWAAKQQGRCYCEEGALLSCRCSRMTADVLRGLCKVIPADCDQKKWAVRAWKVHGEALAYLTGGAFGMPGAKKIGEAKGPGDLICKGSPLVLDLAGDGVELSSVDQGVSFNLNNHGLVRTAWTRGVDDALLGLDRDGDGLISSGRELFGEGSLGTGGLARDGFEALALLDQADHGGNGNFLVDREDLMFNQLVLWTDADHDGVCQSGELRSLSDAGIAALQTRGSVGARVLDAGGNDLSLRASYLRADGSAGLLVDALFVTRAR